MADTVRTLISTYVEHIEGRMKSGQYSRQHYAEVTRTLADFVSFVGDVQPEDLRRHHFSRWVESHPQWQSVDTLKGIASKVSACFNWCEIEGYIESHPFRRLSPRMASTPRDEASPEQYTRILAASPLNLRRILFFMWHTGCRPGEARELLWEDIRLEDRIVIITKHKTMRHTGRPRMIPMDRPTVRLLGNMKRKSGSKYVFPNSRGTTWDRHSLARAFRRICDRIDIPAGISPYSLRHGFATQWILRGGGERQLADIMGHTDTRMVQRYAHTHGKIDYLVGSLDSHRNR